MRIYIDIEVNENEFDLLVSDDCGGSGISVYGQGTEETLKELMPYIEDYLIMAQDNTLDE